MTSLTSKPTLCLVTPALADANNGNWQTARRWARMLSGHYAVHMARAWPMGDVDGVQADLLLALHARRSATSIAAWAQAHPERPVVVALTGTDLYRDIQHDADAQRSLALATRLIVLQDQGPLALPADLRDKCRVVFQSSTRRQALPKTRRHLRVVVAGHLRDEKWPQGVFEAARGLRPDEGICIDHIGQALDPALGDMARATMAACPHYRWLGELPHDATRRRLQRAHLLLHPSRMEGGAHVIMEAVLSGTPVLASRVPGNVGMLGGDYAGYFAPGQVPELLALLRACRRDQQNRDGGLWLRLQAQCDARASRFEPAAERQALLQALAGLT